MPIGAYALHACLQTCRPVHINRLPQPRATKPDQHSKWPGSLLCALTARPGRAAQPGPRRRRGLPASGAPRPCGRGRAAGWPAGAPRGGRRRAPPRAPASRAPCRRQVGWGAVSGAAGLQWGLGWLRQSRRSAWDGCRGAPVDHGQLVGQGLPRDPLQQPRRLVVQAPAGRPSIGSRGTCTRVLACLVPGEGRARRGRHTRQCAAKAAGSAGPSTAPSLPTGRTGSWRRCGPAG